MKLRRLGASGLKVSAVGIGCNNFGMRIDEKQTQAVVDAAIEAGINFFDTADVYGAWSTRCCPPASASGWDSCRSSRWARAC
jgi:aryl-alcohol dehydrogenase-like predicted oxidoreductase